MKQIIDGVDKSLSAGSGATAFKDLTDVPASYAGQSGKAVRVKPTEDGLEYFTASGSGTVTNVDSATTELTVANKTTTPVITIVSAPKLTTPRAINGVNFDGTAPITVADSTKVVANGTITGATKTKITYDTKGLVTSGADATTADIADSLNKRYVTDANLVVIGNTSNTNTGDETTSTIKTKLGITTLSGSNTGDQILRDTVGIVIDGGGSVISTGVKKSVITMNGSGTFTGWNIIADQTGSIVVDVKKSDYASFPTTTSIAGTEKPTLVSARKNQDLSLTTWTTAYVDGDKIEFNVESCFTITAVTITLNITRN